MTGFLRTITRSPDGQSIFIGSDKSVASATASGELIWRTQFSAQSIVVAPDGSALYVSGRDGSAKLWAHDGVIAWHSAVQGSAAVSTDGNHVIFDATTLDSETGTVKWTASGGQPLADGANRFILCEFRSFPNATRYASNVFIRAVAYESATGIVAWTSQFYRGEEDLVYGCGSTISPDKLTAYFVTTASSYTAVIAYDTESGTLKWSNWGLPYVRPVADRWWDTHPTQTLVADNSSAYVLSYYQLEQKQGSLVGDPGTSQQVVALNGEDGLLKWVSRFVPTDGPHYRQFHSQSLGISPNGDKLVVAGTDDLSDSVGIATVDTDTGAAKWIGRLDAPLHKERPMAVEFSSDGSTAYLAISDTLLERNPPGVPLPPQHLTNTIFAVPVHPGLSLPSNQ